MSKEILEKYNLNPKSIRYKNSVKIIEEDNRKIVVKPNKKKISNIYRYLISRNFTNFPPVLTKEEDDLELSDYIEEVMLDDALKLEDMIYLLSILHNKTTFYKEVELEKIKKIYEDMSDEYNYLLSYYQNINMMIEEEIYMSPSNYYFLLNISSIYSILLYGKEMLENWYRLVSQKKSLRFVLNHNNLKKEHFLENEQLYFISWDNANIDFPTSDLVNLFKNNYQDIDIQILLNLYQSKYKLADYEYYLFLAKLCLVDRVDFNEVEELKIEKTTRILQYVKKIVYFLSQNSKEFDYSTNS